MKKGSVGQSPFKVGVRLFPFRRTCWLMGLGLVVLILAGLKITLSDTKAAGVTWEVNNGAYSNDSNCNVSLHQCSSIVAAVGTASPGDVISVVAGSGGYDGFIVTTASLTILGPNALYSPVTSSRFSEAQIISKVTIEPGATGVTIQGFEFNTTGRKQKL